MKKHGEMMGKRFVELFRMLGTLPVIIPPLQPWQTQPQPQQQASAAASASKPAASAAAAAAPAAAAPSASAPSAAELADSTAVRCKVRCLSQIGLDVVDSFALWCPVCVAGRSP